MPTADQRPARLKPARPELGDERPAYMPRVPWALIAIGAIGIGTLGGGYWLKEQRRARELRAQILRVHEYELEDATRRYVAFRDRLENWILRAAWSKPEDKVDPRLRLPGLRAANGLYLRLYAKDAKTKKGIDDGARAMDADAIPACLGLAPASARGVWEKGAFLLPSWVKPVRKETSVMRLRVVDEMLARHIRSDLPSVLGLLQSRWFMLVLQEGETRRDDPVDVSLWDVKREELLLRARIQARGMLVRGRAGAGGARSVTDLGGGAATDCSIASQLKALAGTPEAEISTAASPNQGALLAPDAGAGAAVAPGEGVGASAPP